MRITRRHWFHAAASVSALLVGGVVVASSAAPQPAARGGCAPSVVILESPRVGSQEVQAKALNDRGDIVGFADSSDPNDRAIHAILWKKGRVGDAVDLGVPPGYVSSEAYGINNDRVVFGLLYDKKERTYPFRWKAGHMTLLKGLNGRRQQVDVPDRNAINARGQIVATLIIGGGLQAVRWSPGGTATRLPALPGHTWTYAFSINDDGIVSGWSRKLPSEDGEENPVLWDAAGNVIPLATAPDRADGIAEATNRSGLTVGYLGNLGTDADPERDNATVWRSRAAAPQLLGRPAPVLGYSELVDVNDRGQAAGMTGSFTPKGFTLFTPAIWRTGWTSLRPLPVPAASRKRRVVVTNLNDINSRGDIVGNVYGLAGKAFSKLRQIDPVLWRCPFPR